LKEERLNFIRTSASRLNAARLTVLDEERAFYSKGTYTSNTIFFPFGSRACGRRYIERDYDLAQHQKARGKSLEYFERKQKTLWFLTYVAPSAGVDRTVLR